MVNKDHRTAAYVHCIRRHSFNGLLLTRTTLVFIRQINYLLLYCTKETSLSLQLNLQNFTTGASCQGRTDCTFSTIVL